MKSTALQDQLDEIFGRHLLTRNKAGDLVPLANQERVMRHNQTLPILTAEQEAELFAHAPAPVADKKRPLDMKRGGLVRR